MLTYRLQRRRFRILQGGVPSFPAPVHIEMHLGPPPPFGMGVGGRTTTRAAPATASIDANTGHATIASATPFDPVDVTVEYQNMAVQMKGDILTVDVTCTDLQELQGLVETFYHLLPAILNVDFGDPPHVLRGSGTIGQSSFIWELVENYAEFYPTTTEKQQHRIIDALERMTGLISEGKNRRLAAAYHYFHVACRLRAAGDSPWEFMGEALVNLTKTLQALFGESRDDVRVGLGSLGYSKEEIERSFILVMVLRQFDAAHVMLSIMTDVQAVSLNRYVQGREQRFRTLLQRVTAAVAAGTCQLEQREALTLDAKEEALLSDVEAANRLEEQSRPST